MNSRLLRIAITTLALGITALTSSTAYAGGGKHWGGHKGWHHGHHHGHRFIYGGYTPFYGYYPTYSYSIAPYYDGYEPVIYRHKRHKRH